MLGEALGEVGGRSRHEPRGRRHLRRDRVGRHRRQSIRRSRSRPQQIAAAAIEAAQAGAAVAHIHVRDPQTGKAARQPQLYREVVQRMRASAST